MKRAGTREEFLREMNQRGYQVRWEEGRKSITYTTPTGKKCRDDKLHELKFRKEQMEHEFRIRQRTAQQFTGHPEAEAEDLTYNANPDKPAGQHSLQPCRFRPWSGWKQVLRSTLALQESIRRDMDSLATKKSLEPLATADLLARWLNQTKDLHQGMCQDLEKVQRGIQEENRQAGKQRDESIRISIHSDRTAPERWGRIADILPALGSHYDHVLRGGSDGGQHSGVEDSGITEDIIRLLARLEQQPDSNVIDATTRHSRGDRKALAKEQAKKIAMGHKADDHEEGQKMN